jgi:flagellar protein FliL
MSTAAAAEAPVAGKSKKKLIVIVAAVLLLAIVGGGAAFLMKKKAADAEEDEGVGSAAPSSVKHDPKLAPVFVPLDVFVVNLADRDSERFAQVGVTLEVTDAKVGEVIKTVMPAIRNNVLMAIADRSAAELLGRDGKTMLAKKIKRETLLAMGVELEDEADEEAAANAAAKAEAEKPTKKKKKKKAEVVYPVKAVHFSNFIIQ